MTVLSIHPQLFFLVDFVSSPFALLIQEREENIIGVRHTQL